MNGEHTLPEKTENEILLACAKSTLERILKKENEQQAIDEIESCLVHLGG